MDNAVENAQRQNARRAPECHVLPMKFGEQYFTDLALYRYVKRYLELFDAATNDRRFMSDWHQALTDTSVLLGCLYYSDRWLVARMREALASLEDPLHNSEFIHGPELLKTCYELNADVNQMVILMQVAAEKFGSEEEARCKINIEYRKKLRSAIEAVKNLQAENETTGE